MIGTKVSGGLSLALAYMYRLKDRYSGAILGERSAISGRCYNYFVGMGVIIHKNIWHWGQKITIVIASGRALCSVSVENDDLSVAYLHDLIVHTSIRRRGYGRQLLTLGERRARLMNCKKLVLWADPNEWMIEWYKRNGFVESGKRSDGLVNLEKDLG